MATRTADVQRAKLGTLELVDGDAKEGSPAVHIMLDATHRLDAAGAKSAGELYLKAARTGDATVRLMDEAVRRAATAERRGAHLEWLAGGLFRIGPLRAFLAAKRAPQGNRMVVCW